MFDAFRLDIPGRLYLSILTGGYAPTLANRPALCRNCLIQHAGHPYCLTSNDLSHEQACTQVDAVRPRLTQHRNRPPRQQRVGSFYEYLEQLPDVTHRQHDK